MNCMQSAQDMADSNLNNDGVTDQGQVKPV